MADFYGRYNGILGGGGGGGGTTLTFHQEAPAGVVDGANTSFSLSTTPAQAASLSLTLDGVFQYQGSDYTISGTTITMAAAPSSGQTLWAVYA